MSKCFYFIGNRCALNLFDGKPKEQDCASCGSYRGKSRGLGDKIHNASERFGLTKIAKAIENSTKRPCGCGKRRAKLNEKFPAKD